MPRVFLLAEWRNLIIVSYHVPPALLERYLPRGLEPDLFDGKPAVSLVAFEFRNTRVWGVPWPGFVNFPELNLRFYVKTREASPRRGVVFVREFVPSRFVSKMARGLYNEPYASAPMDFRVRSIPAAEGLMRSEGMRSEEREPGSVSSPLITSPLISAACTVTFNHAKHTLAATASPALHTPHDSTTEHLLKEHQWGYGQTRDGRTLMYEVVHPTWRIHERMSVRVDVDWARLYGTEWGVMQDAVPFSAILAEGSGVTVSTASVL